MGRFAAGEAHGSDAAEAPCLGEEGARGAVEDPGRCHLVGTLEGIVAGRKGFGHGRGVEREKFWEMGNL